MLEEYQSPKIRKELQQLKDKHGSQLPYGTYARLARKYKVTREHVRQQAEKFNFTIVRSGKRKTFKNICNFCGLVFETYLQKKKYCSAECRYNHSLYTKCDLEDCAYCGKGVVIFKYKKKTTKTGLFFCCRECMYASGINRMSPGNKGFRKRQLQS